VIAAEVDVAGDGQRRRRGEGQIDAANAAHDVDRVGSAGAGPVRQAEDVAAEDEEEHHCGAARAEQDVGPAMRKCRVGRVEVVQYDGQRGETTQGVELEEAWP
jgi:hypothetical protein